MPMCRYRRDNFPKGRWNNSRAVMLQFPRLHCKRRRGRLCMFPFPLKRRMSLRHISSTESLRSGLLLTRRCLPSTFRCYKTCSQRRSRGKKSAWRRLGCTCPRGKSCMCPLLLKRRKFLLHIKNTESRRSVLLPKLRYPPNMFQLHNASSRRQHRGVTPATRRR